jgi:hypothetical protein
MAASPPDAQKRKIDYNIAREIYDQFVKACSHKGYAPQVIIEKMMVKFTQTGNI